MFVTHVIADFHLYLEGGLDMCNSVLMLMSGTVHTSAKDPRGLDNAFRPGSIMPA